MSLAVMAELQQKLKIAGRKKRLPLVLEAGATDEFSHDGGRRDFLVADRHEVVQELQ